MSFVLLLSSQFPGLTSFLDSVSTVLTGAPYFSLSSSDSFLNDIKDSSIVKLDSNTGYVHDILLVFLKDDVSLLQRHTIFKSVNGFCIGYLKPANLFVLKASFNGVNEMTSLCKTLMQNVGVVYASGSFAFKNKDAYTPNDPFDGLNTGTDRWDESNPGGGTWWLEAIDARNAWGYSSYFNHMNIGIIDSGFDTNHPDLSGKFVFPNALLASENIPTAHGTHVAGIIAAKGDNGTGICGICQNSTLTCVDWEPEQGQYWIADLRIIFGVGYTIADGAKVVNLSIGSSNSIDKGQPAYPALWMNTEGALVSAYTAILISKGYDFVIVQAAGNGDSQGNAVDSFNNGSFCCITEQNALSGIMGVPAKAVLDRIIIAGAAQNSGYDRFIQTSFSNVGSGVSICAPGSWVYSCSLANNNYYQYMSGTSMAAPIVTAVASLVWAVNPKLTGPQVKAIVCNEANTRYNVPPTNDKYWPDAPFQSYRMVNAQLAVEAAIKTAYSVGTVSGKAINSHGNGFECEIKAVCGDKEFNFSCGSDGTFSFLLPPGDAVINFINSDASYTVVNTSVQADKTVDLGQIVLH